MPNTSTQAGSSSSQITSGNRHPLSTSEGDAPLAEARVRRHDAGRRDSSIFHGARTAPQETITAVVNLFCPSGTAETIRDATNLCLNKIALEYPQYSFQFILQNQVHLPRAVHVYHLTANFVTEEIRERLFLALSPDPVIAERFDRSHTEALLPLDCTLGYMCVASVSNMPMLKKAISDAYDAAEVYRAGNSEEDYLMGIRRARHTCEKILNAAILTGQPAMALELLGFIDENMPKESFPQELAHPYREKYQFNHREILRCLSYACASPELPGESWESRRALVQKLVKLRWPDGSVPSFDEIEAFKQKCRDIFQDIHESKLEYDFLHFDEDLLNRALENSFTQTSAATASRLDR